MKSGPLRPLLRFLAPSVDLRGGSHTRRLHKTRPAPAIPPTRPFVPDVSTFFTLIGRGLIKHASKFPSWESLFSLTPAQLKELGIEPPRTRRYLLQWLHRYRAGAVGPGGDFVHVKNGEALLRIALPPASAISRARWVVNVPMGTQLAGDANAADANAADANAADAKTVDPKTAPAQADASPPAPRTFPRPNGYVVHGSRCIVGPYVRHLAGSAGAVVKVTEGMWEYRRGRKIDGGERRRAEIRFKRLSAERRAEREAEAERKS